jgi:hypothetical protein
VESEREEEEEGDGEGDHEATRGEEKLGWRAEAVETTATAAVASSMAAARGSEWSGAVRLVLWG